MFQVIVSNSIGPALVAACRRGVAALGLAGLVAGSPAVAGGTQSWDRLSTGLAVGLAGAAVATTISKSDNEGLRQGALTAGATLVAVEVLKAAVKERRPDGSDTRSFPSGHTAMAFAAASFFDARYGDQYRQWVPVMYGLAALTGVARVKADKHYAHDALAGAALGWGLARAFTTPYGAPLVVAPTRDGVSVFYSRSF